jgi:hypothetical protein
MALIKFHTPWSVEQVECLKRRQDDDNFHQYTCGNDSRHVLVPTTDGWVCPECDYKQDWFLINELGFFAAR